MDQHHSIECYEIDRRFMRGFSGTDFLPAFQCYSNAKICLAAGCRQRPTHRYVRLAIWDCRCKLRNCLKQIYLRNQTEISATIPIVWICPIIIIIVYCHARLTEKSRVDSVSFVLTDRQLGWPSAADKMESQAMVKFHFGTTQNISLKNTHTIYQKLVELGMKRIHGNNVRALLMQTIYGIMYLCLFKFSSLSRGILPAWSRMTVHGTPQ